MESLCPADWQIHKGLCPEPQHTPQGLPSYKYPSAARHQASQTLGCPLEGQPALLGFQGHHALAQEQPLQRLRVPVFQGHHALALQLLAPLPRLLCRALRIQTHRQSADCVVQLQGLYLPSSVPAPPAQYASHRECCPFLLGWLFHQSSCVD